MPLVACPECTTEVSDKASSCIKCGCPLITAAPALRAAVTEETIYGDSHATITTARAIFNATGRTYSMANISSVSSVKVPKPKLFSILAILLGLGMVVQGSGGVAYFGALVLVLGIVGVLRRPTYFVRITAAGGEVDAFATKSGPYAIKLVTALNNAIVKRG